MRLDENISVHPTISKLGMPIAAREICLVEGSRNCGAQEKGSPDTNQVPGVPKKPPNPLICFSLRDYSLHFAVLQHNTTQVKTVKTVQYQHQ
jgi:hypothetical protein